MIGGATVDWGVATRIGARRNVNQDAYCTQAPAFVVADGMGGHAAGAIASREAVDAVAALSGQTGVTGEMLETCLADASARINQIPVDHGRPPGTTLSGVIVTHADKVPIWMVVNIGDSRTYRVNSDGIRQISIDHSVVQKMINAGAITASAAASLPYRNLLTRALRGDEHRADTWRLPMRTDDRILICSDGLTREIGDAHIARVLRNIAEPLAAADELVNAAGDAGGHDDATALVIDVVAIRQV
ncbi:PP2C family protein-serine/threonine phosphatase [Mycolicibacterium tusciae]|uniref:PP2C family protein-serine/threonine phosphatase n=1 Tax=Mycolicibacterium tusciae TaxID=75922 RepID=UPI001EF7879F|nr:protein phosphatase 2C domain-containing protein [Mycolicibacterium tusciae]